MDDLSNPVKKLKVCLILFFGLITLLNSPPVLADDDSQVFPNPGLTPLNRLYFIDQWSETVQQFFTLGSEAKVKFQLSLIAERIAEMKVIVENKGTEAPEVESIRNNIQQKLDLIATIISKEQQKGKDTGDLQLIVQTGTEDTERVLSSLLGENQQLKDEILNSLTNMDGLTNDLEELPIEDEQKGLSENPEQEQGKESLEAKKQDGLNASTPQLVTSSPTITTSNGQPIVTPTPTPTPTPLISSWSNVQITSFSGNGNIYYGEYPSITWNGGGYGVVWSGSDGTPVEQTGVENIFFKKLDSNGNPLENHVRITDHGYCGCLTAAAPNIVWTGSKYAAAWTDNKGDGNGQNLRFSTLDSNGNKLTDIVLTVPNDNTNTNRPGLKWTGQVFAIAWQGTNRFYAEVGNDGQTIVVNKKVATDSEWSSINANSFNGTAVSNGGKIYFSDTNINQELVSAVSGSNTWPFITWNGTKYGIVWMNVQNNQLQLYFGTK